MKNGSHTVDMLKLDLQLFAEEEVTEDDVQGYLKLFQEHEQSPDDESEDEQKVEEIEEQDEIEEPPAKEVKKVKVKFDKEEREVEVTDDNLPEFIEKSLALDRERKRKETYEKALDRAAKLAGYKDHTVYIAKLDEIEQQSIQQQQTDYEQLQEKLLAELEENGINKELAKKYLENHPLLKQAKTAITEKERLFEQQKQTEQQQSKSAKWNELFQKHPNLVAEAGEGTPTWYTPDMAKRVEAGYDPIDAYELAHRDTLFAQTKKQAEQTAIKNQMFNKRSQVTNQGKGTPEPEVPTELADAFSMFGLSPKTAKKYVKN